MQTPVSLRLGLVALAAVVGLAGCGSTSTVVAHPSPSPTPTPTPSPTPTPTPTPSPSPTPTPTVPSWAAESATCSGAPAAYEALLVMQGSPATVLADVTDSTHPHTLCTITGNWSQQMQLVTQRMISWSATQVPGQASPSVLATMDLFSGTTTLIASWQGGLLIDGLHSWSPDESSMAYVTSDANAVNLHLLSGGGDRVITTLGSVPARGYNPLEDDAFLGFSADGSYFAFVQTYTSSGDHLQIRRTKDGTLAYSQATGTMATWESTGGRLYFREPGKTSIHVWDPTIGVGQLFALQQPWVRPRPDAGDDYVVYAFPDSNGASHVWLYGHRGASGGQLTGVRSSPLFLNTTSIFMLGTTTTQTYVYDLGTQRETSSMIAQALGSWPLIGQT